MSYEVVVLGGGPAGSATAIALGRRGVSRVLVVEPRAHGSLRAGESVPPDLHPLLEQLGIRDEFLAEGHDPCAGSCSSWGGPELGYNDFLLNPQGNGWHLDRARFDAFLGAEAGKAGAELAAGFRFEAVKQHGREGLTLRLVASGGRVREIEARFVVDATGLRAAFARRMGARRRFVDNLLCVYGFFDRVDTTEVPALTMLEAVEYGWWYAARLPDRRMAAAVASDPDLIRGAGLRRPATWLSRLGGTRHLRGVLASCRPIEDSLLVAPAPSFRLDPATGHRWLAVGDAAAAYDPISSQGIHKALSNGLEAAAAIARRLDGDAAGLEEYAVGITARYEQFVEMRDYLYGLETRWPAAAFWQRRQGSAQPDV